MSEAGPEDITKIAEEYLESLNSNPNYAQEELREELEYWEEQVGEFKEGTPMHEIAVGERDGSRKRLDEIEARGERHEQLSTELLMRASEEFIPQGEWLEPSVVKALSYALTGHQMNQLLVGEHTLPEDAEELSKREMVSVAKVVHSLAEDAIESNERIVKLWDKLDTETQRSILGILARYEEPLSSGKISDELGEDGTDNPGSNIRYLRGEVNIDPYRSTDDGYTLTLAGRYVWEQYGPSTQELAEREDGQRTADEEAGADEETVEGEEGLATADESADSSDNVDLSSFEVKD